VTAGCQNQKAHGANGNQNQKTSSHQKPKHLNNDANVYYQEDGVDKYKIKKED